MLFTAQGLIRNQQLVAAAVVLVLVVVLTAGMGYFEHQDVASTDTKANDIVVTDQPSDGALQREDEVIVENASEQVAENLTLIVHRVDALAKNDDTFSRITLRVGGIESRPDGQTSLGRRLPTASSTSLRAVGFSKTRATPSRKPLAVVSNDPSTPNVTVLLPTLERVQTTPGLSYEFVVAHELGGAIVTLHDEFDGNLTRTGPIQTTTDSLLARQAVNEGIANNVGAQYVERYRGTFNPEIVFSVSSDAHWLTHVSDATYLSGYRYAAANSLRNPSTVSVNTTAAVLHPGANRFVREPPIAIVPQWIDSPGEPTATDRLGELVLRELLITNGVSPTSAGEVAAGWRNGRVDSYDTPNGTVTAWTTIWTDQSATRAFTNAYGANVPVTPAESFERERCLSAERLLLVDGQRVTVVRCS